MIWASQSFVQIAPKRWMTVLLKPGWELKILTIKLRVYPVSNEARHIIDNTFDEMHKQSRLQYTTEPTSFNFLVFIVYKTNVQGKNKGRTVVDIQMLNYLVLSDSYSLPLQSEIIANVQGCTNLAIFDTVLFIY